MFRYIIVIYTVASVYGQGVSGFRDSAVNSELMKLDQLFRIGDREQYDRRQTPSAAEGTATRVHIEMYIRSFGSINPIHMDYTVDLYLRQRWLELRFLNNSLTRPIDLNDPILVKFLWKPEVYFPNAKESDFQYVTVPNVMLRIHPDGTILYILRLKLTFSCMMDLSSFPLDHQTCYIQVASFVKTTRELELVWYDDNPIKMYKRLKLPQFQIKDIKTETCRQSFHIGNYSCLQAVFELRRNVGYHLVQSYLPTSLIVVVSWVSFWLDVDAIPSRVTLGVTTLLTVCSESTSFRDKMPTVSYVKALDIWMGSCTAFVFLALVEFTVVNHLARHHRRYLFWGSKYVHLSSSARECSDAPAHSHDHASSPVCYARPSRKPSTPWPNPDVKKRRPINFIDVTNLEADKGGNGIKATTNGSGESEDEVPPRPEHSLPREGAEEARAGERPASAHGETAADREDVEDLYESRGVYSTSQDAGDEKLSCLPSRWKKEAVLAKRIDKICRAVFPIMFILFNIVYWDYYEVLAL
ncbi:glycine receptor subunit alpha-2-like isoform X2 [Penaeus japonicus]|uniref:glycine receptor subunit alpha-2-like isoform X2 n=1 Tax=Penaeus japonicus TaxID=27405 RepID=UPI001C712F1D|nr:glycine receptor subunit alpha-2-like isoform X2 [Penaeus japonicus]